MQTTICSQALIPMRSEPSERAELVTQILFGEPFVVLKETENWNKVRLLTDAYEGWIDSKTANTYCSESEDFRLWPRIKSVIAKGVDPACGTSIQLPLGALLPGFDPIGLTTTVGDNTYQLCEDDVLIPQNSSTKNIAEHAHSFLPAPYLWGGKTLMGIDCSGFTQLIYRLGNYWLPRDASQQIEHGETIDFIQDAQVGDLVFFDNPAGNIVHVGIVYSPHEIIHASGKVRIDTIDQQGIFNTELNKYTHQLRLIKRLRPD